MPLVTKPKGRFVLIFKLQITYFRFRSLVSDNVLVSPPKHLISPIQVYLS